MKLPPCLSLSLLTVFLLIGQYRYAKAQLWFRADLNLGGAETEPINSFRGEGGIGYNFKLFYHLNDHFSTGLLYGQKWFVIGDPFFTGLSSYTFTSALAKARWDILPNRTVNVYQELGIGVVTLNPAHERARMNPGLSPSIGVRCLLAEQVSLYVEFDWLTVFDRKWIKDQDEHTQQISYAKKMNSEAFCVNVGLGFRILEKKK